MNLKIQIRLALVGLSLLSTDAFVQHRTRLSTANTVSIQTGQYSYHCRHEGDTRVRRVSGAKSRFQTSLHQISGPVELVRQLHSNRSYVMSLVLWLSTAGISLERRTMIGKALSAPLATMALALTAANLGIMPFKSPICKLHRMYSTRTPPMKTHFATML